MIWYLSRVTFRFLTVIFFSKIKVIKWKSIAIDISHVVIIDYENNLWMFDNVTNKKNGI
jgi:hypothetical protein